jgi:O-antigen/teichoic acid export membrane protein
MVSLPAFMEPNRARLARLHELARLIIPFLSLQLATQVVSALSGVLVVRLLAVPDFAIYAIAVSVQACLAVLSDVGVSTLFLAKAGTFHADTRRIAELANAARALRFSLLLLIGIIAVPLLWWSLRASEPPLRDWLMVFLLVAVTVAVQVSVSQDGTIALAMLKPEKQQLGLLISAALRLATFAILLKLFPSFLVALVINLAASLAQAIYLRRVSGRLLPRVRTQREDDRRAFLKVVKNQAFNALYYAFSAQLTLWLVGILSAATVVAQVGALGRLSNLLVLAQSAVLSFFAPRFARYSQPRLMLRRYIQILGLALLGSAVLLLLAILLPGPLLWIIGPKYQNLRPWLPLAMASALTNAIVVTVFGLHSARAWIEEAWISIPLTIAVQVVCLLLLDVSKLHDALLFGWASSVPPLLVQVYVGIRRFRLEFAGSRLSLSNT